MCDCGSCGISRSLVPIWFDALQSAAGPIASLRPSSLAAPTLELFTKLPVHQSLKERQALCKARPTDLESSPAKKHQRAERVFKNFQFSEEGFSEREMISCPNYYQ